MIKTQNISKYFTYRGSNWYYQRFVSGKFSHVDTPSVEIARVRRGALVVADDNYGRSLVSQRLPIMMALLKRT